jgi:hypothetical protein
MEWLFERKGKKIMRRTPLARATALIGRVSDMTSVMKGPSGSIAEENRPEGDEITSDPLLRGHSVTEDVTIMSQEGFQLSSGAAPHHLPPLRLAVSLAPLELNLFFFSSRSSS